MTEKDFIEWCKQENISYEEVKHAIKIMEGSK